MNFILIVMAILSFSMHLCARVNLQNQIFLHKRYHETDITKIEPQYPSYITHNHFGLCLKASQDLDLGVIVGTNDCTVTDKEYIAGHESLEHRHSMVIGVTQDGKPIFGRGWGKGVYTNHSCDPNCKSIDGNIVTIRNVKKDEELTTSYDQFIPGVAWDPKWNFKCFCNTPNCRLFIDSYKK